MTATVPAPAATQNGIGGRSWARGTATTAVAAGRIAMTIALWFAGAVVRAYEVSIGNPITTPPVTTAILRH